MPLWCGFFVIFNNKQILKIRYVIYDIINYISYFFLDFPLVQKTKNNVSKLDFHFFLNIYFACKPL